MSRRKSNTVKTCIGGGLFKIDIRMNSSTGRPSTSDITSEIKRLFREGRHALLLGLVSQAKANNESPIDIEDFDGCNLEVYLNGLSKLDLAKPFERVDLEALLRQMNRLMWQLDPRQMSNTMNALVKMSYRRRDLSDRNFSFKNFFTRFNEAIKDFSARDMATLLKALVKMGYIKDELEREVFERKGRVKAFDTIVIIKRINAVSGFSVANIMDMSIILKSLSDLGFTKGSLGRREFKLGSYLRSLNGFVSSTRRVNFENISNIIIGLSNMGYNKDDLRLLNTPLLLCKVVDVRHDFGIMKITPALIKIGYIKTDFPEGFERVLYQQFLFCCNSGGVEEKLTKLDEVLDMLSNLGYTGEYARAMGLSNEVVKSIIDGASRKGVMLDDEFEGKLREMGYECFDRGASNDLDISGSGDTDLMVHEDMFRDYTNDRLLEVLEKGCLLKFKGGVDSVLSFVNSLVRTSRNIRRSRGGSAGIPLRNSHIKPEHFCELMADIATVRVGLSDRQFESLKNNICEEFRIDPKYFSPKYLKRYKFDRDKKEIMQQQGEGGMASSTSRNDRVEHATRKRRRYDHRFLQGSSARGEEQGSGTDAHGGAGYGSGAGRDAERASHSSLDVDMGAQEQFVTGGASGPRTGREKTKYAKRVRFAPGHDLTSVRVFSADGSVVTRGSGVRHGVDSGSGSRASASSADLSSGVTSAQWAQSVDVGSSEARFPYPSVNDIRDFNMAGQDQSHQAGVTFDGRSVTFSGRVLYDRGAGSQVYR